MDSDSEQDWYDYSQHHPSGYLDWERERDGGGRVRKANGPRKMKKGMKGEEGDGLSAAGDEEDGLRPKMDSPEQS